MYRKELLENIDRIHTTKLGVSRIKNNLELKNDDVITHCKEIILDENSVISKKGKNYYVNLGNIEITVNSSSFTVITAHLK